MIMKLLCFGALLVALSGCAGVGAETTLKFDGSGNGTHSETPKCDDQGKVKGSGSIPDGGVIVTLQDSSGKQLFQRTFQGEFTLDEETLTGASGTWHIEAQRSGDGLAGDAFAGNYAFYVNC
jgi:hypothetical protein